MIEVQILLRCSLTHITIIMLRFILYFIYLYLWLGLGLFMPYLCDLFFIFNLLFIVINHKITWKQTNLFFAHISEYLLLVLDINVEEKSEYFFNSKSSASGCCLAFAWFLANFILVLLVKVLLTKKRAYELRWGNELFNWCTGRNCLAASKYPDYQSSNQLLG